MRVVQALGWYYPESIGGTESYVAGLASALRQHGVESLIAAPIDASDEQSYDWDGTGVFRYPVRRGNAREVLNGQVPHPDFNRFTGWLEAQGADLYHQHSLTTGAGLHHLAAARSLGLPTVLTIHVPGPVCLRGTMLLQGTDACDGRINIHRCAACWLQSRGVGGMSGSLLARMPPSLGGMFSGFGRPGTALGATTLVARHQDRLSDLARCSDRIVAVCQWLYDALLLNGVPEDKLLLNRQGATRRPEPPPEGRKDPARLVIGFLGRWDPVKGLAVLVEAVRGLPPDLPVQVLARCSNADGAENRRFQQEVEEASRMDPRIQILPMLQPEEVQAFLGTIDILAVPSQWLETGPLVVLESFSAGVPVLGSRLGGIQELVQDEVDGLLIAHDDPRAWRGGITRLLDAELRARLRRGIGAVRTMDEVAFETLNLYRELAGPRAPGLDRRTRP
ncbi:MAG: glycosyltransferase [Holophagaceae bacterium]|nr:glycosyltransferase [Holophagaceae bacterium]